MISQHPCVSVVMPVYNGERYVREAVESILNQTLADFEFIIIDDGSTDGTGEILTGYAARDSRIVLVSNEENIGLARSLNKGLALARRKYIARMDGDDISWPERLARQVRFLETRPEIGVLGTAFQWIDTAGKLHRTRQFPTEHGMLKWGLCFGNPIAHPSVMMRREVVTEVGGYNAEMITSQDHDLWQRLSGVTRLANLPEVLLYLRVSDSNVTSQQAEQQRHNSIEISQRMVSEILGEEIPFELVKRARYPEFETFDDICQVARLIYRLGRASLTDPMLSRDERRMIRGDAAGRLLRLFQLQEYGVRAWKILGWACRLDALLVSKTIARKASCRLCRWLS